MLEQNKQTEIPLKKELLVYLTFVIKTKTRHIPLLHNEELWALYLATDTPILVDRKKCIFGIVNNNNRKMIFD